MATGTVKWFNPTKGYGFIQPSGGGGKDVFVHISAVERAGFSTLREGQQIEYEIVSNRGKESARESESQITVGATSGPGRAAVHNRPIGGLGPNSPPGINLGFGTKPNGPLSIGQTVSEAAAARARSRFPRTKCRSHCSVA